MAPANAKANYKTYEAQARMVRAIVAAHPEVKWNYKEIAACYGSDMTDHALNHRFRKVRATVNIINDARVQGLDIKDLTTDENLLPSTQAAIDKNNIAKYFGQSTTDGIQFQFRTIKKDAENLRQTANEGGDVANCLNLGIGSGPNGLSTPSKPTPARGAGSRSGKGSKRKVNALPMNPIKRSASDDEDEDELNFDDLDNTPSKRVKTTGRTPRGATPARSAARKAAATITDASAQYQDSESPYDDAPMPVPTPAFTSHPASLPPSTTVAPTSLFGDVERKPQSYMMPPPGLDMMASTEPSFPDIFTGGKKSYTGAPPDDSSYMDWGDGEI
ncbi:Ff.00g127230.m01.CDS01 [Fusarium sp. VM40]|nr:Ff.00g127230.m01.CDS01 [Fusarium sp. VM40]